VFDTRFATAGNHDVSLSAAQVVSGCPSITCAGDIEHVSISPVNSTPSVTINTRNPTEFIVNQSDTITATGRDQNGNTVGGTYSWTTSNPNVVSIVPSASQVQVSANGGGSANLSVAFTTASGTASAQVTINVARIDITKITTTEAQTGNRRTFGTTNVYLAEADSVEITGDLIPDLSSPIPVFGTVAPNSDGSYSPVHVQASTAAVSVFTATSRDINVLSPLTSFGYGGAPGAPSSQISKTLVEQELVRMIYGEGRSRTIKERTGLGSVVLNRINNSRFPPTPTSISQVIQQPNQFAGWVNNQTLVRLDIMTLGDRSAYDQIVDLAGQVQENMVGDPTLGSIFFVTPTAGDISFILAAYYDQDIGDAKALNLHFKPVKNSATDQYQLVLLNTLSEYQAAAQSGASPFVFWRIKQPGAPTVVFN